MDVHIGETRELSVPWVHAPEMASERYLQATRVLRVIEVVVPLRVGAQGTVVDIRRQRQRGTAAPTADQLRCEQFPFLFRTSIRPEESIEGPDARLVLAKAHICAVATKDVRLRHRQRNASFTWISKDELAGLDRPSLAGKGLGAAALNRRLVDAVLVSERVEIARLGA